MAATVTYVKGNFAEVDVSGNTTFRIPHATLENIYVGGTTASEGTAIASGGVIKSDYIPNLDASKITTGIINAARLPSFVDDVIELIAYAANAPTTCATGDQYYNSTQKKIYTATAPNTWGTTGVEPETGKIYVVTGGDEVNRSYRWGGSTSGLIEISQQVATTTTVRDSGADDTAVPTELAVRTAITSAVNGGKAAIASGSTAGIVFVSGTTSSSNGVTLSLNTSTGALTVTADLATDGDPGVVQLVTDWQTASATTFWDEGGGKDTSAATPNYVHMAFANGKGMTFNDTNKTPEILLDSSNPGLAFAATTNALKVDLASSNPGLEIDSGLKLKVFASHGLTVDSNGVYVSLANGNGLELDSGNLKVKLKATGSELVCDTNGVRTLMQWIPD